MYGYYGYLMDSYYMIGYLLVSIAAAFSIAASAKVKSSFAAFSRIRVRSNMTGAEVAAAILKKEGIYDAKVQRVKGHLTDHFNPSTKIVNLSDSVYGSNSIAAVAVAAHECGHAVQHNEEFFPLKFRSAIVPVVNFQSKIAMPLILLGLFIPGLDFLMTLGIILFSATVLFHIVTLPVEFDASRRALAIIEEMGIVTAEELPGARKVLKSAALTYVASAAAAVASLLRLILISKSRRRKD